MKTPNDTNSNNGMIESNRRRISAPMSRLGYFFT